MQWETMQKLKPSICRSFAVGYDSKDIQRKGKGLGGKGPVQRGGELKSKEQILKLRHRKERMMKNRRENTMKRRHGNTPKGKGHQRKANKKR